MGNRLGFDRWEEVCNLECDGAQAQNLLTVLLFLSAALFPDVVTWARVLGRVRGVCTIGCTAIGNVSTRLVPTTVRARYYHRARFF